MLYSEHNFVGNACRYHVQQGPWPAHPEEPAGDTKHGGEGSGEAHRRRVGDRSWNGKHDRQTAGEGKASRGL